MLRQTWKQLDWVMEGVILIWLAQIVEDMKSWIYLHEKKIIANRTCGLNLSIIGEFLASVLPIITDVNGSNYGSSNFVLTGAIFGY